MVENVISTSRLTTRHLRGLVHVGIGGRDGVTVLLPSDERRRGPPLRHAAQSKALLAGLPLDRIEPRRPLVQHVDPVHADGRYPNHGGVRCLGSFIGLWNLAGVSKLFMLDLQD